MYSGVIDEVQMLSKDKFLLCIKDNYVKIMLHTVMFPVSNIIGVSVGRQRHLLAMKLKRQLYCTVSFMTVSLIHQQAVRIIA